MKKIITFGASNSKKSINKQLAIYAAGHLENVEIIAIDLNDYELPIFSIDLENESGFPNKAKDLSKLFDTADGFVVSFAEHNGAYTAAFKNTFDWLSRIEGKVWRDKPMLLLATSPGARGGQSVLEIALNRFPFMGGKVVDSLSAPSFYDNFKNNELINEDLKSSLVKKIKTFQEAI